MECARCHDHKYDPLTQKEFYQLYAFFNQIDEAGLYSYFTQSTPTPNMLLLSDDEKRTSSRLKQSLRQAESVLLQREENAEDFFQSWLQNKTSVDSLSGLIGHYRFDDFEKGKLINEKDGEKPATSSRANQLVPGKNGQAIQLTGDDPVSLKIGNFHRYDPFSIALWMWIPEYQERAVVFHRSRAWTDSWRKGD